MREKTGCENSKKHVAPFFTVTTSAREVGAGTRIPGRPRIESREVVTRLCSDCLLAARIVVDGKTLLKGD